MKRYRVIYYHGDRSKPYWLIQISKSEKYDGVRIGFREDGKKYWQENWKNDLLNGIDKEWWRNSKNWHCRNWKKGKTQGTQIDFEK